MSSQIERDEKKNSRFMQILILIGIVYLTSLTRNCARTSWKERNTEGEAIYLEAPGVHKNGKSIYYNTPFIKYYPDHISSFNLIKVLNAIETYIHLKYDERNINFEKPTTKGRYDKLKMKRSLKAALSMTIEGSVEMKDVYKRYRRSDLISKELADCKCGIIFGIEGVEHIKEVNTRDFIVSVVGKWYAIGDEVDTSSLTDKHKLFGKTRIWLIMTQGVPLRDAKGNDLNQDGIFVLDSYEEPLTTQMYNQSIDMMSQRYIKQLMH